MKIKTLLGIICLVFILITGCESINYYKHLRENSIRNKIVDNVDNNLEDNDITKEVEYFFNEPNTELQEVEIKIFKEKRILELYGDGEVVGRFKLGLGVNPKGDKNQEGDSKTPQGNYYICTRNETSQFHKFLGISYPNGEDAERGIENNLINEAILNSIKTSEERKERPNWYTPLGGEVGIHGGGSNRDWTLGCIALSNDDVDIIWKYAKLKTPVIIYE